MDATSPIRASHRFLRTLLSTGHKGLEPRPEELDAVSRVFAKAGGSWRGVFHGSTDDIDLLKRVVGVAVKGGRITKAPQWGG